MTREDAVKHLENMKWLKGYSNTMVDGVPIGNIIDDIVGLLKAQEPITGETSDGYHTFNELYHHSQGNEATPETADHCGNPR